MEIKSGLRGLALLAILAVAQCQYLEIETHIEDNFIVATAGDFGVFFQEHMENDGSSFKIQIRNLKTDTVMWETDPAHTPINLKHRVSTDLARYIEEGYLLDVGFDMFNLNVTNIHKYELTPDKTTLKMYVETDEFKGYSTEILFKLRIRPGCIQFKFAVINSATRVNHITWGFKAQPGEGIFGFGERFIPQQNKTGQYGLYSWPEEGGFGAGTELRLPKGPMSTYMPIPFFLSSATGWGYLLNTTYESEFDLDHTGTGFYHFSVETANFEMKFYTGNTPAESLALYTEDTGRSLIPPLFQFAPWNMFYNEFEDINSGTSYQNAMDAWERFVELDIPSSVAIDETRYLPIGEERFKYQSMLQMNQKLKERGLYVTSYINPNVDIKYLPFYEDMAESDYFIRRNDGSLYTYFYTGAKTATSHGFQTSTVDFSNPAVLPSWHKILQRMIDDGFNGWMYDYAEYVDPDNVFKNGLSGRGYHNKYPLDYQKACFDYLTSLDPERVEKGYAPEYMYYVRSGYIGTQAHTWTQWTGDPSSDFTKHSGLPAQLSGMLAAGMSGIPFLGSDIGGFVWTFKPTKELWIRWTQLGTFSGTMHTQTHGTALFNEPKSHIHDWSEGTYAWRKNAKFRTQLLPYMYDAAHEVRETGLPMMRHLLLHYPSDRMAISQEYEYMFGDSLLVAPVVEEGKLGRDVYLPEGDWYFLNGDGMTYEETDGRFRVKRTPLYTGKQTVYRECQFDDIAPVAIKAGRVLAMLDATVDTVRDTDAEDIIPLSRRAGIIHLLAYTTLKGEIPHQVVDGVMIEMKRKAKKGGAAEGLSVSLTDQKEKSNRVVVLQLLLNESDVFSGLSQGKEAQSVAEMWNVDESLPGKGELLYKYEDSVLLVRFGGRPWIELTESLNFDIHLKTSSLV